MSPVLRDASDPPQRQGFECACCGRLCVTAVQGLFRQSHRRLRPGRFCNAACRQAAYRRRRAGVPEDTPAQLAGGSRRRLHTQP